MAVGVGSFFDGKQFPGLAHFCEHMLFLGTKKYLTLIANDSECLEGSISMCIIIHLAIHSILVLRNDER